MINHKTIRITTEEDVCIILPLIYKNLIILLILLNKIKKVSIYIILRTIKKPSKSTKSIRFRPPSLKAAVISASASMVFRRAMNFHPFSKILLMCLRVDRDYWKNQKRYSKKLTRRYTFRFSLHQPVRTVQKRFVWHIKWQLKMK